MRRNAPARCVVRELNEYHDRRPSNTRRCSTTPLPACRYVCPSTTEGLGGAKPCTQQDRCASDCCATGALIDGSCSCVNEAMLQTFQNLPQPRVHSPSSTSLRWCRPLRVQAPERRYALSASKRFMLLTGTGALQLRPSSAVINGGGVCG